MGRIFQFICEQLFGTHCDHKFRHHLLDRNGDSYKEDLRPQIDKEVRNVQKTLWYLRDPHHTLYDYCIRIDRQFYPQHIWLNQKHIFRCNRSGIGHIVIDCRSLHIHVGHQKEKSTLLVQR